jgi:hypothetical protein
LPFNVPGASAGSNDEEYSLPPSQPAPAVLAAYRTIAAGPFAKGVAARRHELARLLGPEGFAALAAKADTAHAALTAAHPRVRQVLGGADAEDDEALRTWWLVGWGLVTGGGALGAWRTMESDVDLASRGWH